MPGPRALIEGSVGRIGHAVGGGTIRTRLVGLVRAIAVRGTLRTRLVALACAIAVLGTISACASGASPSFDPSGPCSADVRVSGAYPALEARIPKTLFGRPPDQLDSGRNCTDTNLGSLTSHGIHEVRFAGGRWDLSATSGITLAVFEGDGLTPAFLGEWYEASARSARNTTNITPTRPTIDGRQGYRLDTLNGDSRQTVVVWPSANGGTVQVVLTADVTMAQLDDAIAAFR